MNILIPPIVNMPRVCDECPEDLCLIGYTPPCPSQCYDFDFTCEPIYNSYECSGTFTKMCIRDSRATIRYEELRILPSRK